MISFLSVLIYLYLTRIFIFALLSIPVHDMFTNDDMHRPLDATLPQSLFTLRRFIMNIILVADSPSV